MNKEYLIRNNERLDDLHRNGYFIIQDPGKFCFGVDAVLLTDFTKVKEGERVIDLGTGTGVVPILLTAKTKGSFFAGIDIQKESVDMAKRSVMFNSLEDRVEIKEGDIKDLSGLYGPSSFDVVTTNPPYIKAGGGLINASTPKGISRHELLCNLEDVAAGSARLLKPSGRLYMVHKPHRLTEIITTFKKYKLEPKRIQFVHPYVHKKPNMMLIEAVKGGREMVDIMPSLIIYNSDGSHTREVLDIYYN